MNTTDSLGPGSSGPDAVFEALASRRRRSVLQALDRFSRVDLHELAAHVVAEEQQTALQDVTQQEVDGVAGSLVHVHLPKLSEAGLVSRSDDVVSTTDHSALTEPAFRTFVETGAPGLDDVLDDLASRRRRIVLSVLYPVDGPMPRSELAIEAARRERDHGDEQPAVTDLLEDLHHVHLPKLDEGGLVTYAVDAETATYEGHPALDDELILAVADSRSGTIFPPAR